MTHWLSEVLPSYVLLSDYQWS